MAELVDALDSGSSGRNLVQVQVLLSAPPRSDTIFAHRNFEKIASVSLQSVAPFFPFRVIQHSWEPYIVRRFFSFCWSQNFIYGRLPTLAPLRTSAYGDPKLIL